MKKFYFLLVTGLMIAVPAIAAITVNSGPTSLVTSPITAKASSAPIALFSVNLSQTDSESLSSVTVNIANNGSSTAVGSDIDLVSVYKDDGNGLFDSSVDMLSGSQSAVNIGTSTVVTTSANNTIGTSSSLFFVTLKTAVSWSDTAPSDSITVALPADGIVTSANSPTTTAVTTSAITADTTLPVITIAPYATTPVNTDITVTASTNEGSLNATSHTFTANGNFDFVATDSAGNVKTTTVTITNIDKTAPTLVSAVAMNTGGTGNKEAGDSIALTFSEATNATTITAGNIGGILVLNNIHSFLDGSGALGGATWNASSTILTITLSAGTSTPTVMVGDTVTVSGGAITDLSGNAVTGTQTISGSFSGSTSGTSQSGCTNNLINGRLYQITGDETVYLAAACRLKEFKGQAVGRAKGGKFLNIITLSEKPADGRPISASSSESGQQSSNTNTSQLSFQALSLVNIVRDLVAERKAMGVYVRLFNHLPRTDANWKLLHYLAYGGAVTNRNLLAERIAVGKFLNKFRRLPTSSSDWLALHALAYGAE